jgi:hypothetical protein
MRSLAESQVRALVQDDFYFLDRADDSLGIAALFSMTDGDYADLYFAPFERRVISSRILQALV